MKNTSHFNFIQELYLGNIAPVAKASGSSTEYVRQLNNLAKAETELLKIFSALPDSRQRKLFEQFAEAQAELNNIGETERFIEGFRMGAAFMLDTFMLRDKGD